MNEKPPIYVEDGEDKGRVEDPQIAKKMAETEDPYHKKILGVIPPWKKEIAEGEEAAEKSVKRGVPINEGDLPEIIQKERDRFVYDVYNSAMDNGKLYVGGYRMADYGGGKMEYIIDGELKKRGEWGKGASDFMDGITIRIKVEDGRIVEKWSGKSENGN